MVKGTDIHLLPCEIYEQRFSWLDKYLVELKNRISIYL